MKKFLLYFVFLALFFSCSEENKSRPNSFVPKIVTAKGYIVPSDSLLPAEVISAVIPEPILAGKPLVVPANTNIKLALEPKSILAGKPLITIPGKDSFEIPRVVNVVDSPFVIGNPEIVLAKDGFIKDNNPQNFSSFKKLQGLKSASILCMMEDHAGNLWFGTNGAGVTKYDGKYFTHITMNEGLSAYDVRCMLEDRAGNIWIGTNGGGLNKYDGKRLTIYNSKNGLSSDYIFSLLEDKAGHIWIGTNGGGVDEYDGKTVTQFGEKQGLSNNMVTSLIQDKVGNIWMGVFSEGVFKYNGHEFSRFSVNEGMAGNNTRCIYEDKAGNLWFGYSGTGVTKYDGVHFYSYTVDGGLAGNDVRSVIQDHEGDFWFTTNGSGICKYDGKSFTQFSDKEGLPSNDVRCSLEDRSGNLWFGTTADGVSKFNGKLFTHYTTNEGLSNNVVFNILDDRQGNLWFGTNGRGVNKYDGNSFSIYTDKEGLCENRVLCSLKDRDGNLWFGTLGNGISKFDGKYFYHFSDSSGLNSPVIFCMLQDRQGNFWFGTSGHGVVKFDGKSFTHYTTRQGLSNDEVRCVFEDKDGNLWFGTNGGGVNKFDGKNFTQFSIKEGLSFNDVRCIHQDKSGNLWFGTYGGGIDKYDGKTFTYFSVREGLVDDYVFSMEENTDGDLWVGTRMGLSKLKMKNLDLKMKNPDLPVFINYTYEDGFLGIGCNTNSICREANGNMWIGTNDRLTLFHLNGDRPDSVPPNIQLTGIDLFNEHIPWDKLVSRKDSVLVLGNGVKVSNYEFDSISKWYSLPEQLSLNYYNNYITFNFIGITQKQSKKVKYQYKLEGIDDNWSALTSRNDAPYGNLPNGKYIFKVMAMNSEGIWSDEFAYEFVIRPPWWKTWWFRTFTVFFIAGSVIGYFRYRTASLRARQKQLEQTVEERTAEVVQQKHVIEEKHKEITDSINYAERIQRSFLATKELLNENLKEHFVFFKPKDVVSGDFYWASELDNGEFLLATADSTGHGVPGAIMSILNISCLEKSVEEKLTEPAQILNYTRAKIIERLKKDGSVEGGKDGMDCSLICFDFKNKMLRYAAANNPVWIVRENQLLEFPYDKMPVGKHDKDQIPFSLHEVQLQKGDVIYSMTDGFQDQFGGPKGKKFMNRQLKELLVSISNLPMQQQHNKLDEALKNWKSNLEQVDDICLIGIRI